MLLSFSLDQAAANMDVVLLPEEVKKLADHALVVDFSVIDKRGALVLMSSDEEGSNREDFIIGQVGDLGPIMLLSFTSQELLQFAAMREISVDDSEAFPDIVFNVTLQRDYAAQLQYIQSLPMDPAGYMITTYRPKWIPMEDQVPV